VDRVEVSDSSSGDATTVEEINEEREEYCSVEVEEYPSMSPLHLKKVA
jgi:hypothetical protein